MKTYTLRSLTLLEREEMLGHNASNRLEVFCLGNQCCRRWVAVDLTLTSDSMTVKRAEHLNGLGSRCKGSGLPELVVAVRGQLREEEEHE